MGNIANRITLEMLINLSNKIRSRLSKGKASGDGNSPKYDLKTIKPIAKNCLYGKHIGYLGSSVTYGACSEAVSFVEYIAARNNTTYVKEAVSGTTLVDDDKSSYVSRMKTIDTNECFDLFVVQLSTNDATQRKPLGSITAKEVFDTHTIIGAMEYIITYVQKTWHCPVIFYTGSFYKSEAYSAMVKALKALGEKYPIGIIDMYEDKDFNNISPDLYKLYMHDPIHPTKAGYLKWWVPKMEAELINFLSK